VFLPGFACPPTAYRSFLEPVVARVGRVVVPALGSLVGQVTGRSAPEREAGGVVALVDRLAAEGSSVWLAGHSRGGLVAWHAAPLVELEGLVLVDPVSGTGPPWHPPEPPPAIDPICPVTIIGFGLGGRCAPAGRNHESFADALPSATHVVVPGCGHADVLGGVVGRLGRLTCGHGAGGDGAAPAARRVLVAALDATGSTQA
jgi:pimeloyl-ACP methyl ester carboxylesterase